VVPFNTAADDIEAPLCPEWQWKEEVYGNIIVLRP